MLLLETYQAASTLHPFDMFGLGGSAPCSKQEGDLLINIDDQVPSSECAAARELPGGQHAPSIRYVRAGRGGLVRPTPEPGGRGQLSQNPPFCEKKEYAKISRGGNDRRKRRKFRFIESNAKSRH